LLRCDNHYYSYDDNGNMIEMNEPDGFKHLTYSVDDRMISYQSGTTTGDYYYDIYGLRVKKEVNGEKTYFVYDGSVLLGEITFDISGQVKDERYYIFIPGTYYPLDMVVLEGGQWKPYAYHNDHLGTPRVMTNQAGNVVWEAIYRPFGEIDRYLSTKISNYFRFPGQYEDELTGLYYNYQRYYITSLGRYNKLDPLNYTTVQIPPDNILNFLSREFIFNPQLNPYIYTQNNSINKIDYFGTQIALPMPAPFPALGPAAAVTGAFMAGYLIGTLIEKLIEDITKEDCVYERQLRDTNTCITYCQYRCPKGNIKIVKQKSELCLVFVREWDP